MDERYLRNQLKNQLMRQAAAERKRQEGFEGITATEIYCPKCKRAMPVREKLLLALPRGELFDYICEKCGTSLGTRTTG